MKLDEVIKKVAGSTGVARADVKKAVNATFAEIKALVEGGEKVIVPKVGAFVLKERPAGEKVDKQGKVRKIEAAKSVTFRATGSIQRNNARAKKPAASK